MNFSAWSIRNPIAPLLAFVMLMVLGWQSFSALPITRFPNIDVPLVAVTVTQAGAAPAELETQITKEIEDAVAGITGVKNILSTVADGVSTTSVEFRMEVPTDKAVQDTKDAIDQILGDLPGEAWCMGCGETVAVAQRFDPCPRCGSHRLQVTKGDDMRIMELEVE